MSSDTQSFNIGAASIYQYALIGVLGAMALLGCALFVRSRIDQARRIREGPTQHDHPDKFHDRPRLYETYLGSNLADCEWHAIMPFSVHSVASSLNTPTKSGSTDVDPLASGPLRITTIIVMPFLPSLPSLGSPNDECPPYLEIGITKVAVPSSGTRESVSSGQ
ncbi:hypothetical protein B0H17DRAFT_1190252 [Mycena rosella]|uniref:Uncharacterized protein n=1 Tax=Mycena rosella TaxID=1033263 RepID=A0AAD7H242_MYCRO|nr:hypothetical protein B0H17DRAFT_1190252 [Mycena rosella]